jgi:hypothetical protein
MGMNPARGMDVCLLCLYVVLSCVCRGLCDGLIPRPEDSYRVFVCVMTETPKGALCSSWEATGMMGMNTDIKIRCVHYDESFSCFKSCYHKEIKVTIG